jgi:hypothetical protein
MHVRPHVLWTGVGARPWGRSGGVQPYLFGGGGLKRSSFAYSDGEVRATQGGYLTDPMGRFLIRASGPGGTGASGTRPRELLRCGCFRVARRSSTSQQAPGVST